MRSYILTHSNLQRQLFLWMSAEGQKYANCTLFCEPEKKLKKLNFFLFFQSNLLNHFIHIQLQNNAPYAPAKYPTGVTDSWSCTYFSRPSLLCWWASHNYVLSKVQVPHSAIVSSTGIFNTSSVSYTPGGSCICDPSVWLTSSVSLHGIVIFDYRSKKCKVY
jgi:hypothetical protein